MNLRIFLFNENPGRSSARTVNTLKYVFEPYLNNDDCVKLYPGIKDAASDISAAFKDTHVILFLTAVEKYAETKKKLARSFNINMEVSEALQAKAFSTLGKIIPNASAEEYAHCVVPTNARTFTLDDGLYTGFSVASGNQTIIFLPLQNARTETLLATQVIPYINSAYHSSIDEKRIREFNCNALQNVLKDTDKTVCVAQTNTTSYFMDYISADDVLSEKIKIANRSEKRGNVTPEKYIINLSIMAKELMSATYGVAMSNAYYTGEQSSEKTIYLAVTTDKQTAVRKITSLAGEEIDDFLARASGDLCIFTSDVIATETDTENAKKDVADKKIKKYKTGIMIITALIALVCAAIVFVFTSNNYSFGTWFSNMKDFVLPGQSEIETTIIYVEEAVT